MDVCVCEEKFKYSVLFIMGTNLGFSRDSGVLEGSIISTLENRRWADLKAGSNLLSWDALSKCTNGLLTRFKYYQLSS